MIKTPLSPASRVIDLKHRLAWGEPALTIVDVRDRAAYNRSRIMGALSLPMADLVERALDTVELTRDIYVYGETDDETAVAAQQLRMAGFVSVSELKGGLAAWKALGYQIEGYPVVRFAYNG